MPQLKFISNCLPPVDEYGEPAQLNSNETAVLQWNVVGTCILRKQMQFTSIDVEFTDKNFHRNFSINDDFNVSMACLNYSGLFLASKGERMQDLDAYEEEEQIDKDEEKLPDDQKLEKKRSYVFFKPTNEWKQLKDWHYKLDQGEYVDLIAQGTDWCAALTDQCHLRIFTQTGVQKQVLYQNSNVITMTGYENLLAIVYHGGLPIFGQ